ncbi:MAG: hypothetical protein Q8O89_08740 [Nanoarchaeota archaeon]|nr:hypothetical protein [Nanoarchaeota archaeon]
MVSISWCLSQKKGIKISSPNENMSDSYLRMAEESIGILGRVEKSKIWTATTAYYIFYYSLYAMMLRLGIKCEIHSCSLELMKKLLNDFYSDRDIEMIEKAFSARSDLQYYADRPVDDRTIEEVRTYCKQFYIKTKDILSKITESEINSVRETLIKIKKE